MSKRMKKLTIKDCVTQCPHLIELEDRDREAYLFCEKLSIMLNMKDMPIWGFPEECPLEDVEE
jgi:hypothetical protein